MATFLDFSLLRNFAGIFTWLLVWIIAFGILDWVSPFGKEKKGFHAIIALALAFLVLFTEPARYMVEFMVPWLTVVAIGVFFMLFVFMAFGVKGSTIQGWATSSVRPWLIGISIVVILFALGGAFGQPLLEEGEAARGNPPSAAPSSGLSPQEQVPMNGGYPSEGGEGQPAGEYPSGQAQPSQQDIPRGIDQRPVRRNTFAENLVLTFTHPKMLAVLFVLLLGTFTIVFLSKT